jgi:uncharacterized protein with PhoU and TrkA domain
LVLLRGYIHVIRAGDLLIAVGDKDGVDKFQKLASGELKEM